MERINGTYSDLLRDILNSTDYTTLKELYDDLLKDKSVSYSSFVSYCNGTSCPTLSKAKLILDSIGYQADESVLSELLERTKVSMREVGNGDKYIQHGIRIPVEEFEMPKGMLERVIQLRAEEKTGKAKSFNAYMCMLLKEDLKKSGLI